MKKYRKNKFNNLLIIIALILIVGGFMLIIYPPIKNNIYEKKAENAIEELIDKINNDTDYQDKTELLYNFLKEENNKIYESKQSNLKDPFSYSDSKINLEEYGIDNGVIGYIKIPKMQITIPIYLGANKENLNKGVAHLTETSYPIGGINTNSVLAAHRGHSSLKMFSNITVLKLGDLIYIYNFKEELIYEVSKIEIIGPTEIDKLLIEPGKDKITLITCHPKYLSNKRYVVFATRK